MGKLNEPVEILVEFLRAEYKEPARTGYSKRHTSQTDNFVATAAQTTFTLTETKALNIDSITVDAVAKKKYIDYNIDLRSNQIIFLSGLTVGQAVVVIYDYGPFSWINQKDPEREASLKISDYPRIAVTQLSSDGTYWGMGSTSTFETYNFQIDVVTKDLVKATNYVSIDSSGNSSTVTETNMNRRLVQVLVRGIKNTIKRNLNDEIGSIFWQLGNTFREETPIGFEEDRGIFRTVLVVSFSAKDLGER